MQFGLLDVFENTGATLLGALTDHGLPIGQGPNNPIAWTAAPTDGQVLIGKTGFDPVLATLTAGSNIAISNGAGSITISTTGITAVWQTISSNTALTADVGYICTGGGTLTLTLPAAVLGDEIFVVLNGSTGWILQAGAFSIRMGSSLVSAGGSLASTSQGDGIHLVCQDATTWIVVSSMGNLTIS